MKKSLLKFLSDPSKLASKFDWSKTSGSILALDVGSDKIGLAIASHPSHGESAMALDPMPIKLQTKAGNRRVLSESTVQDLQSIVQSYNVCGFLVSWPVQKEGRCGAPCGKVLHTLDSLVEESNILNSKRPFCLWDEHHHVPKEDSWGRTPQYGEVCTTKTLYKASEEQYVHKCSSNIAVEVWNDYCSKHWPELCGPQDEEDDDIWGPVSVSSSRSQPKRIAQSDIWLDAEDDHDETYLALLAR